MKQIATHLILIFTLTLLGCNENNNISNIFLKAEQLMDVHPDSALLLLQDVESRNLVTKEGKARHALLLSQAYDKNYIDLTNDSLINIAVEYYADSNDKERYFTSLYYLARVQYNAGLYTKSMLTIIQAEELASEIKDKYKLGLMYAYKGKIYSSIYDPEKSIPEYMSAIKNYRLANKDLLEHDLLLNVADAYFKIKNYEKAEKCIKESIEWAYKNKNENLLKNAVNTLILMYDNLKEHTKIKDLYKSKYFKIYNSDVVINLSLALYFANNEKKDSTIYYLNKAEEFVSTSNDTILLYNRAYIAYKRLKDYENALLELEKERKYGDYLMRTALKQPVVTAERDYYKLQTELTEYKLTIKSNYIIISLLLSIILLFSIYYYYKYSKNKIELMNDEIGSLVLSFEKQNKLLAIKDKLVEEKERKIYALFNKQFTLLNKLCTTYYETSPCKKEQFAIFEELKKEMKMFNKNEERREELEAIINEYMDNIIIKLKEDFNDITTEDLHILCLILLGFSGKSISAITGFNRDIIYARKSRIKKIILNNETQHKDTYMKYLFT